MSGRENQQTVRRSAALARGADKTSRAFAVLGWGIKDEIAGLLCSLRKLMEERRGGGGGGGRGFEGV